MARGPFITFEGSEGCGKSTQIQFLAAKVRDVGREVVITREPGGTDIGEQLRHLLQFAEASHRMTAEAELLLFAASRAQLVRELIEPALSRGQAVLADRFHDSTTVYQGVARRLDAHVVATINDFAVGGCLPNLTFVLDLDPELARTRLINRARPAGSPDRMEQQPPVFYESVRAGYLALAAANSGRVRIVNAAQSSTAIADEIWAAARVLLT